MSTTATITETDSVDLSSNTCWIVGAGASYDCIGNGHFCVPLTHNLIRKAPITDKLQTALKPLIATSELTADSFEDAVGARIERTIDEQRGLAARGPEAKRVDAAAALAEMIRVIAAMISVGSIGAMYHDEEEFRAENYGWLAFQTARFSRWSIVTLNYDTVLNWAFELLLRFAKSSGHEQSQPEQYLNWTSFLETMASTPAIKKTP